MSKVKMTNGVIKSLIGCLEELTKKSSKLPITVWYNLSYNRTLFMAADKLTEEARIKLVDKFGVVDKETKATNVPQESIPDFQKEYIELLEMEVKLDVRKIKMSTLDNAMDGMEGVNGLFNFFEFMVDGEE